MCGRYLVLSEDEFEEIQGIVNEISERYKDPSVANGEVFPTNNIPVVYPHNGRYVLSAAKWGFPSFKGNGVIINARAESVAEKPMFKGSFMSRRCIVPANGYYEWLTHEDRKKTKYYIRVKDKSLFYMAGLYNMFTDKSGIIYPAVTVITTNANEDISFIHDRMPVILPSERISPWMDANNTDVAELKGFLTPYEAGKIIYEAA